MATVTISSKFQLVIPKAVRESMALRPGQQMRISFSADRLELERGV